MPAVQSTYSSGIRQALAGMVATQEGPEAISRIVEDAAGIGFGIAVWQGAGQNGITATPADTKFRGITIRDITLDVTNADIYQQYATAAVAIEGVIWVVAGHAVVAGDPVYVDAATNAFTNVATNNFAVPRGAIFDSSAASGALVKVRLS